MIVGGVVSWSGDTCFAHNEASESVGGLNAAGSSVDVSWRGNTVFRGNIGGDYGGAVRSERGAVISWDGNTTFVDNFARFGGGAVHLQNTTAVWEGITSFSNNTAPLGGAVYVEGAILSWTGQTSFTGNTADSSSLNSDFDSQWGSGGALHIKRYVSNHDDAHASNVLCGGLTTIADNTAGLLGGAISDADAGLLTLVNPSTMTFVSGSNTTFSRN